MAATTPDSSSCCRKRTGEIRPSRCGRALYFLEGQDELTVESKENCEKAFVEVSKYPVPDLVVVGHTDKVGSDQFNDELALRRAKAVRDALIARGVAPVNIVAVGRGKRDPLVPTADGVAEPRNRRVEIVVR